MKPWERYQQNNVSQPSGPWQKYQTQNETYMQDSVNSSVSDYSSLPQFDTTEGVTSIFGEPEGAFGVQLGKDTLEGSALQRFGRMAKDGFANLTTFSDAARADQIEKNFPELQVERIQGGTNAIITNPQTGGKAIISNDKIDTIDTLKLGAQLLPGAGLAKLSTAIPKIGRAGQVALAAGATDAVIQGGEKIQGSEQSYSPTRTALAAGTAGVLDKTGSSIAKSIEDGAVRKLVDEASPSLEALKDKASQLYQKVDEMGVTLRPEAYQGLVNKLKKTAEKEGFIPENETKTAGALNALIKREGQELTFNDLHNLRRTLGNAAQSIDKADSRIATKLIKTLDNTLENIPASATTSKTGATGSQVALVLKEANKEYSKSKRSELIEQAIQLGESAKAGPENGIRSEFNKLDKAIIKNKVHGFSKEEADLIKRIGSGRLTGTNALRLLGNLGFNLTKSGAGNPLGGTAGAGLAGVAGGGSLIPILAQQAASNASRVGAEKLTKRAAKFASQAARLGGNSLGLARAYVKTIPKKERSAEQFAKILKEQGADAEKLLQQATAMGGENKQMIIDAANMVLSEKSAATTSEEF